QREGKDRRKASAQITSPPLLLPRSRPIPVPRDLCSQLAVQLRTRGSPSSALLRHHLRCQLRYGIRDIRPCLTPWQRILHQQEKSLEHFPKRCPALRETGPSVMSHSIHYKSDSVEPPHPLSPLPQRGEGRFNSNSSTITRNGLFEIPPIGSFHCGV